MMLEPFSSTTWRRAAGKRRHPLNPGKKIPQSCSPEEADGPEGHPPSHYHMFLQPPPAALQESPWTYLLGRQLRAHPCKQGNIFPCKAPGHQSSSSKVQLLGGLLPSEASYFVSVVPTATRCVCQVRVEQQGSGALETKHGVTAHQKEW